MACNSESPREKRVKGSETPQKICVFFRSLILSSEKNNVMSPDHFLDHGDGDEDKEQEGDKLGYRHSFSPLLLPDVKKKCSRKCRE